MREVIFSFNEYIRILKEGIIFICNWLFLMEKHWSIKLLLKIIKNFCFCNGYMNYLIINFISNLTYQDTVITLN